MGTRVFGASDDLIEFEGDVYGEVGYWSRDKDERGCLLIFSDGTLLRAKYGKPSGGIWQLDLVHAGSLFKGVEVCSSEDADPHSDVARFEAGLTFAFAATEWQRVE